MSQIPQERQERLLDAARKGDDAALETLLAAVQPQLYRFSMRMCRHEEDAEDVLQDSMLTLARNFKQFRGDSSLSTWLYSVARSMCIKKRRKSKFAPEREESWEEVAHREGAGLADADPTPEAQAEKLQAWEQVQEAILQLTPEQREVLVLRDVEGLSAKEVATVTETSVSAVKSRLHRARVELRKFLSGGTPPPTGPECPNIVETFSRYLEDELTPDVCSTMQAHVDGCPRCAAECNGLKSALNACSSAPCEVPEHVAARVQAALRDAIAKSESL